MMRKQQTDNNPTLFCYFSEIIYLDISGETDWKIICIDVTDPLAKELNGRIFGIFSNLVSSGKLPNCPLTKSEIA